MTPTSTFILMYFCVLSWCLALSRTHIRNALRFVPNTAQKRPCEKLVYFTLLVIIPITNTTESISSPFDPDHMATRDTGSVAELPRFLLRHH